MTEINPTKLPRFADDRYDPFGAIDSAAAVDCNAMIARLYTFLDGELTDERRQKIQGHLDACPTCFSAFDFEAELRLVISKRTVTEVPPTLAERIRLSVCPPTPASGAGAGLPSSFPLSATGGSPIGGPDAGPLGGVLPPTTRDFLS